MSKKEEKRREQNRRAAAAQTQGQTGAHVDSDENIPTLVIELLRPTRYDLHHGVTLLPGENNVRADLWEQNRTHPMVKQYIDAGHIAERGFGSATPITDQLNRVTDGKARMHIDACEDVNQLLRWKNTETRAEVRDYLDGRIELLRNRAHGGANATQTVKSDEENPTFDSDDVDDEDDEPTS